MSIARNFSQGVTAIEMLGHIRKTMNVVDASQCTGKLEKGNYKHMALDS